MSQTSLPARNACLKRARKTTAAVMEEVLSSFTYCESKYQYHDVKILNFTSEDHTINKIRDNNDSDVNWLNGWRFLLYACVVGKLR